MQGHRRYWKMIGSFVISKCGIRPRSCHKPKDSKEAHGGARSTRKVCFTDPLPRNVGIVSQDRSHASPTGARAQPQAQPQAQNVAMFNLCDRTFPERPRTSRFFFFGEHVSSGCLVSSTAVDHSVYTFFSFFCVLVSLKKLLP